MAFGATLRNLSAYAASKFSFEKTYVGFNQGGLYKVQNPEIFQSITTGNAPKLNEGDFLLCTFVGKDSTKFSLLNRRLEIEGPINDIFSKRVNHFNLVGGFGGMVVKNTPDFEVTAPSNTGLQGGRLYEKYGPEPSIGNFRLDSEFSETEVLRLAAGNSVPKAIYLC